MRTPSEETAAAPITAGDEVAALVDRARAGDNEAFGRLVVLHQRPVTRLALRLLGDADLADVAAQDAFVRAWRKLGGFRGESSFGAWVARIVVNRCRDQLKRKRVVIREGDLDEGEESGSPLAAAVDPTPDPEQRSAGAEIGRRIAAQAARLPRRQREIFALRYYQCLPLSEIAAACGLDVGTVKTHLSRATHRVRRALEAAYGPHLPV